MTAPTRKNAVVAHGTPEQVAAQLGGHLEAGADHVPVRGLGADPLADLLALAAALGL